MHPQVSGEAIILSQDDADEIAQAVQNLTETIWDLMARRRILLRTPVGNQPARLKAPPLPKKTLIDELF